MQQVKVILEGFRRPLKGRISLSLSLSFRKGTPFYSMGRRQLLISYASDILFLSLGGLVLFVSFFEGESPSQSRGIRYLPLPIAESSSFLLLLSSVLFFLLTPRFFLRFVSRYIFLLFQFFSPLFFLRSLCRTPHVQAVVFPCLCQDQLPEKSSGPAATAGPSDLLFIRSPFR